MSDEMMAVMITMAVVAGLIVWVPMLHLVRMRREQTTALPRAGQRAARMPAAKRVF